MPEYLGSDPNPDNYPVISEDSYDGPVYSSNFDEFYSTTIEYRVKTVSDDFTKDPFCYVFEKYLFVADEIKYDKDFRLPYNPHIYNELLNLTHKHYLALAFPELENIRYDYSKEISLDIVSCIDGSIKSYLSKIPIWKVAPKLVKLSREINIEFSRELANEENNTYDNYR